LFSNFWLHYNVTYDHILETFFDFFRHAAGLDQTNISSEVHDKLYEILGEESDLGL